jgi:hypothetical protein
LRQYRIAAKRNEPAYVTETARRSGGNDRCATRSEIAQINHRQRLSAVFEDAAVGTARRLSTVADRLRLTILGCGSSPAYHALNGDWGNCDPDNPRNRRMRAQRPS